MDRDMSDEIVTPKQKADELRQEAKDILYTLLGLPNGFSSDSIDRLVDCIIGAAIIESAILFQQASAKVEDG